MLSRTLKQRIDFDEGVLQAPALAILFLCFIAIFVVVYFAYVVSEISSALSIALWLVIIILIVSSYAADFVDAILSNGMLVAAWLALVTSIEGCRQIAIEEDPTKELYAAILDEALGFLNYVNNYLVLASRTLSTYIFAAIDNRLNHPEEQLATDWTKVYAFLRIYSVLVCFKLCGNEWPWETRADVKKEPQEQKEEKHSSSSFA